MTTFRCAPPAAAANRKASPSRPSALRAVDIHCHVHSEAAAELACEIATPEHEPALYYATAHSNEVNQRQMAQLRPKLTLVEERLFDMDRMGIEVQAISPSPFQYYYYAEPELGRILARTVNENLRSIVGAHPDRFTAMGTVPLQEPRLAVEELDYCYAELGMRGIEISSHVNGIELSRAGLEAFFARAEALGIMLFLHPIGFTHGQRFREHYFNNVIGNPLESTLAVSHLIFDGVLERHPDLKLCIAHGGGYLPTYAGRMDHAHRARPDCRERISVLPSQFLARLYFDTVVFDPEQLGWLVARYGADHILLGTDYPFDMGESDPVGLVNRIPSIGEVERTAILWRNAADLLGLRRHPESKPAPRAAVNDSGDEVDS